MPPSPTPEDPRKSKFDPGPDGNRKPTQLPSPEYDPATERPEAEWIQSSTAPKSNMIPRTVTNSQEDPNKGRCFITNRPTPFTKLEYVWGIGHRQFNLETKHNVLNLRADWFILFDHSQWMLIPEVRILEELKQIYLTEKCPTSDLRERFENEKGPFNYYVVPAPSLRDAICRFSDVESYEHKTYAPPFSELGPLESHIHPHYVTFNTGQKLSNANTDLLLEMSDYLSQSASITSDAANSALLATVQLYRNWLRAEVPTPPNESSNSLHPPGEEGRDGPSQGGPPPRCEGLRSATRSQGQGSQASADQHGGGQQRASHPFQPPEDDDSSSVTDDTIVEDDTAWIEYIHNWQKQGEDIADSWEPDDLNNLRDKQLSAYIKEHARTPPSPGVWDCWESTWDDRKSRYPSESDRAQFSSNDWAVFKSDVYLTRPDHPQVTL
ncbi:hypothetical protein OG21DRAFT_1499703 [Imleria badia]|nr:hypothetical protein OG21DRAFT_1499703 [Imleria badia]